MRRDTGSDRYEVIIDFKWFYKIIGVTKSISIMNVYFLSWRNNHQRDVDAISVDVKMLSNQSISLVKFKINFIFLIDHGSWNSLLVIVKGSIYFSLVIHDWFFKRVLYRVLTQKSIFFLIWSDKSDVYDNNSLREDITKS